MLLRLLRGCAALHAMQEDHERCSMSSGHMHRPIACVLQAVRQAFAEYTVCGAEGHRRRACGARASDECAAERRGDVRRHHADPAAGGSLRKPVHHEGLQQHVRAALFTTIPCVETLFKAVPKGRAAPAHGQEPVSETATLF